jgi:hypothetical protein
MDLKLINLNVTKNFFDLDDLELAQHICSDVGVLNSYDDFSGKRCNIKNRYFITKKSPKEYCFFADKILKKFNQQDLVRIEVANDTNGFWLKPHNDHPERISSVVVYVNGNGPGTTFYDDKQKITIPWEINKGIWFKTIGLKTYDLSQISHGVEKEEIPDVRSTMIISFVKNWKNLKTCYNA